MAETLKVLGQANPLAATLTDAYTVPGATTAVVSTLYVTNRSSQSTTFRIAVAVAGAADDDKQYRYYDTPILGNDTFAVTSGMSLGAGDVIRVQAANATLSFNIDGVERTP